MRISGALGPLNGQIMERQKLMLKRVENLRDMKDNLTSVQERIKNLDAQRLELKKQGEQLDQLRTNLALTPAPATHAPRARGPRAPGATTRYHGCAPTQCAGPNSPGVSRTHASCAVSSNLPR